MHRGIYIVLIWMFISVSVLISLHYAYFTFDNFGPYVDRES
jgi:hypothetical protein